MSAIRTLLCTVGIFTSQLSAQSAGSPQHGGGPLPARNTSLHSAPAFARTNPVGRGFVANRSLPFWGAYPWFDTSYNYPDYNFYSFWDRLADEYYHPPKDSVMRLQEPPAPPPPPPVPVVREYHWTPQVEPPAPFSIVTTGGTEYLATLVWVEGSEIHFNSVDGGVQRIPRASVSRQLTQAANARKKLNLPLP
jgi:hypothetical protein